MATKKERVLVVGAGPAGVSAALRAADLGASTTLVTSGAFGGMAANDGPVPVRTLAHAARLMRDVRQMPGYGIEVGEPVLDYAALLARVRDVVGEVGRHSILRQQLVTAGAEVHDHVGLARLVDPHTVETERGQRFEAERIILCTGGKSRPLPVPGFEHVATHSDAWGLKAVPPSMIVIGAGATGLQVASIFAAFGTRVGLFEAGKRILPTEDGDIAAVVAEEFRHRGIEVHEGFGALESFEPIDGGIRMTVTRGGEARVHEAALAVAAIGWIVDAAALNLPAAGVTTTERGFIAVDEDGRTSAPHIYAAGDAIGGAMLVPQAMQQGFVAASAALGVPMAVTARHLIPVGSFTDPEYARVGLTEAEAGSTDGAVVAKVPYAETTRPIIDGRILGFCKLIADRSSRRILGCSIVGERAVDIVQVAAIAMAAGMRVDELAAFHLSFPIYAGILSRTAARLTYAVNRAAAAD